MTNSCQVLLELKSVIIHVRKVCWWWGGVACLIIVSLQVLSFENLTLNSSKSVDIEFRKVCWWGGGGGLFDYSVTPGPFF